MRAHLLVLLLACPLAGCDFYQSLGGDRDGAVIDAYQPDAWEDPTDEGPGAGRMKVVGRIFDAETGQVLAAAGATGAWCDEGAPTADGPCSLRLRAVDAVPFATGDDTPLAATFVGIRDDGVFMANDLPAPDLGFVALVLEDRSGAGAWVTSWDPMPHRPGTVSDLRLRAVRTATDQVWSQTAGLSGKTFSERGVMLVTFRDQAGNPVSGVQVTRSSSVQDDFAYYFRPTRPPSRPSTRARPRPASMAACCSSGPTATWPRSAGPAARQTAARGRAHSAGRSPVLC